MTAWFFHVVTAERYINIAVQMFPAITQNGHALVGLRLS